MNTLTFSRLILVSLCLVASAALCHAGKDAALQPAFAKPGKAVLEEKFDNGPLAKPWNASKGDWQIKDGLLVGKEKKSDQHAGVLFLDKPGRNSIIQFSFRLDGAKGFNLSYNSARGHLFRIIVNDDGLSLNKDKDKKDNKSKAAVLGKGSGKFEKSQWYSMLVEVKEGRVAVQTDGGLKIETNSRELDVDKTGFRFVTRGESLLLDDVKVWSVE